MRYSQVEKLDRASYARKLAIGAQESLLHHVLGVLFVASHTKSEPEDGAAVLLDEQSKGFAVTRLRPLDRAAGLRIHPSFRLRFLVTVRRIKAGPGPARRATESASDTSEVLDRLFLPVSRPDRASPECPRPCRIAARGAKIVGEDR